MGLIYWYYIGYFNVSEVGKAIPSNFPTSQNPPEVAHSLPTEIPSQHPDVVPRTPRTPRGKDPDTYPRFYPVVKDGGAPKDPQVCNLQ